MGVMTVVRLLQLTDTHLVGDPHGRMRGICTLDTLRRVLSAAAEEIAAADALLLTGDVVHDDPDGYAWARAELGALGKPVLCLPGNHDDPSRMREALADPPFRHLGHHDFGAWRVVMLDSTVPGEAAGALSPAELSRLQDALAPGSPPHALVVLHHQPLPVGGAGIDSVGLRNGAALRTALAEQPSVRALLAGHVHQANEQRLGDILVLTTPSTCLQFRPGVERFEADDRGPACRHLELLPDGALRTQVLWAD
jgi:Icc protein